MDELRLRDSSYRLLDIIWKNEPMSSRSLTEHAKDELGWEHTTTYTVLKDLTTKGFCQNVGRVVTSLVPREKVQRADSVSVVNKRFSGSLPSFVTAFVESEGMSEQEANEIIEMLRKYTEK